MLVNVFVIVVSFWTNSRYTNALGIYETQVKLPIVATKNLPAVVTGTRQAVATGTFSSATKENLLAGASEKLPSIEFLKLGCWKDTANRTLFELEEKSFLLDGLPIIRSDSLTKCYKAARYSGYTIFALQNGGRCLAGNGVSYQRYGKSNDCKPDGKGGLWANEVYTENNHSIKVHKRVEFRKLGCWKDAPIRALFELEGKSKLLDGSPQQRLDPLIKCYKAAKANGYIIFSLQLGGQCFAGNGLAYQKYGFSSECNQDGRGGTWANEVYQEDFKYKNQPEVFEFKRLGCWIDTPQRSLVELEGKSSILDKPPQQRNNSFFKCYKAARQRGFKIFSLQHGGECFAGNGVSYQKFGISNACNRDGRGGVWANEVYTLNERSLIEKVTVKFKKLGCWKDTPNRALFELEGKSPLLDGSPQLRLDPLLKCYEASKTRGFSIFSLQNGGQCFAGNGLSYQRYGQSKECNLDGRGGIWANEVFEEEFQYKNRHELLEFKKLGCWKDAPERSLVELEGKSSILDGWPQQRTNVFVKCYKAATERGFKIFSLQFGGQCFGGNGIFYQKYGKSYGCNPDGRGGTWTNEVYKINEKNLHVKVTVEFRKLGCWKDTIHRALFELEGKSLLLDGSPQQRLDPLIKCYEAAKANGYSVFSLQFAGQCFAGNGFSYRRYGRSNNCNVDGRGGTWANEVYEEDLQYHNNHQKLMFTKLGCWKDTAERLLVELEGKSSILDGSPKQRADPLGKCYRAANERGFQIFSLQYGGQCFAGNDVSYQKFGKSKNCNADGRGGIWANEVYVFGVSKTISSQQPY